jgi:beta-galactosidase
LQLGAAAVGSLVTLDATSSAAAADPRQSGGRQERSFDADWRFNHGDVTGAQTPSFDDSSWQQLDLPHDWSIEDLPNPTSTDGSLTDYPSLLVTENGGPPPGFSPPAAPTQIGPFSQTEGTGPTAYMVGGIGWYRKTFEISELPGPGGATGGPQHVELRFDGVYQNADVWINGAHLGFHPFGYTPFTFDITPYLNDSDANVIAVRVDNSGLTSRWYSGSGIYRHTWVTVTGAVRVPAWGVQITTPVADPASSRAVVSVSIANLGSQSAQVSTHVTVFDPHGQAIATSHATATTVQPMATGSVSAQLTIDRALLWSPESPSLYTAAVQLLVGDEVADTVTTTFGIRSLQWDGTRGFQLNGKPVKVFGGCVHDTHGPLGAVAVGRTGERRVELLLAAGFNMIRTAHNPPTPSLLDACDRLGMLVWDEFTDCWDTGKNPQDYHVYFPQYWQQDLTAMIQRDRNHPSVVIWSIGNEIVEDSLYATRGAQLTALVHSLDSTRPVTLGGGSTAGANDPSWNWVDVGDGHYDADGNGYAQIHSAHPGAAITQSESFGATYWDDSQWSADNPWAVGSWIWAAWDYLGESGLGKSPVTAAGTVEAAGDPITMPGWSTLDTLYKSYGGWSVPYPWFNSNCGDLDLIGQIKPQNAWHQAVIGQAPISVYVERPVPAGDEQAAIWWTYYDEQPSWNWNVRQGQEMTVHVYTPGDSVTLSLNGSPVGGGPVTPQKCIATFTVPYAPGTLTATASGNGKVIGRQSLVTTGAPAALRLTSDVNSLTTSPDALAHVLVDVVDVRGRVVPDAVLNVSFEVDGAGTLAGVGNGNPHNIESFRQPHRYTWHGQALAVLAPAKHPGQLTLTASASGLHPARIALPVRQGPAGSAGPVSGDPGRVSAQSLRLPQSSAAVPLPLLLAGTAAAALLRRRNDGDDEHREEHP